MKNQSSSSSSSIFELCALSALDRLSSHARLWRFLAPKWAQDFSLGRSPRNPQKSDQALQKKLCSPIGLFIACDVQRSRTRTSSRTRTIGNLPFLRLSLLTSHLSRRVAAFPHFSLLAITLVLLALTQLTHAADQPASAETRLREMLRTTILQLRAAETERAALQAAQAESAAKEKALTEQVEALTKQSAADKDASDRAITDLKAKVADQDTQITQLKDALEKWKEGYAKAADIANVKEAERAKLASQVILLDRKVADRETKNAELFRIGSEILRRYERFGLGDVLAAREPFVGIARVKLENQVQDYQDKLLDQKIKPGQPPSNPAPEKPEQTPSPTEQKTKPQSGKPNDR